MRQSVKRHIRACVACVMALVMALAMSTVALAATVTNNTDHSYNAYQIFSGTQAEGSAALGDVQWGTGIRGEDFLTALKADSRFVEGDANIFASCTTAEDVAEVLADYSDESDVAKAFANVAAGYLTGTPISIAADATTVALDPGYYLLVDTTTPGTGDAMNSALLQVTEDITIENKYSVPSVDKSVKDTDNQWGEAADWEIGSDVPFQLVGTLPSNYADYETYKYVFHDTLSAGLQCNGDVTVYVQNGEGESATKTDITSSFIIATGDDADQGDTLTISCANLKAVPDVTITASSKIVVEYTAELLSTAEIGQPGNNNKVYLEFSNNPNWDGTGTEPTGDTPEDEVIVFTYELDVTKVDGADDTKRLSGAEFVLLNSEGKVAKVSGGKFVEWVEVPEAGEGGTISWPEGTALTSGTDGKFVIAGLDAGTYYLRETKAPAGYNLLKDDIELIIAATLDKSENNPALTALTLTVDDAEAISGTTDTNGKLTGAVEMQVKNNTGTTLPETGGMGTTLFYAVGGILVVGAAVLLVVRRRMSRDAK